MLALKHLLPLVLFTLTVCLGAYAAWATLAGILRVQEMDAWGIKRSGLLIIVLLSLLGALTNAVLYARLMRSRCLAEKYLVLLCTLTQFSTLLAVSFYSFWVTGVIQ